MVYALALAERCSLDFLLLCETHLRDNTSLKAIAEASGLSGARFRVYSVCRPDSHNAQGRLNKPSGGLAVLCFNPRLSIDIVRQEKKGLMSFVVSGPNMRPCAFVAVYFPPVGSVYSSWTDGLVASAVEELNRLRQRFGDWVFLLGDVNMRFGRPPSSERFTSDDTAPTGPRGAKLRAALRAVDMTPVHGRTNNLRAVFTSRHVDPNQVGFSEVDIIAAPVNLPSDTFKLLSDCPTWGDPELPDSGTHLPVLIEMAVPAAATVPVVARPPPKAFCNPPYSDIGWCRLADRITSGVPAALSAIRSPTATATSMYNALRDLHRDAAVAQFGTAAMRTRTYRHRLYRGVQLPAPIVAMFADARAIRQQVTRAVNPVRKQTLHEQAHAIASAAKKLAEAFVGRFLAQLVRNVEAERPVDPRNMHAHLRAIEGTDSTRCIDSTRIPVGPAGTDPGVLFHHMLSGLSTETDPLPQGPQQAAHMSMVPQNATDDELVRLFTAKAVYWLLYPATKRHQYVACHDDCRICSSFIAWLNDWNPDDLDSPAPHHSPSMQMGRSAGPDELIAELIRFVRPEDYSSRYAHRMAICGLVASWFNEMLRTGLVPDGDFAKCCTTPLLKAVKPGQPVPPLWDPNVYRGITNGNMLAKLFSVALAMRMSHWAVRTGTLGPEQVAFLQHHNTEEHVFTLLQVTRARARDGLPTYGLFVDFTKAYDMVHQSALWLVLARMGVPAKLVSLLRDWAAKRRTRVKVNGRSQRSTPWPRVFRRATHCLACSSASSLSL